MRHSAVGYAGYQDGRDANWYDTDVTFQSYLERFLPQEVLTFGKEKLNWLGRYAPQVMDPRATHTDREGQPRLIRYNRLGEEISAVWCNEGYQQTVHDIYQAGIVGLRYATDTPIRIPFFYQFAMGYLVAQSETGFYCPVTLTASCALVLEKYAAPELRDAYLPHLAAMGDNIGQLLQGATWLTEITGGSDVGATQSTAHANEDGSYSLNGEKWFASNADAGLAITLARMPNGQSGTKGLGLFLVPRILPDGTRNGIEIRRLKDKLGVRAVPSGEVLLKDARGYLIGQPEYGFRYMAEALNLSRIFTAVGTLGISRRAFLEAAIYASRRRAFGHPIEDYPMVRESLMDLMIDMEAGWALISQALHRYDAVHTYGSPERNDQLLYRLLVSFAKHRCSERAVQAAKTALELHGGNGYIEEWVTPRLLRDAQVNTVWEGTANIMALDLLRMIQKERAHEVLTEDVRRALASIDVPELAPEVDSILRELHAAEDTIEMLFHSDTYAQSAHAKQLLDYLVDIVEATYLLEHAAYMLQSTNDARSVAIARWYVDKRLLRGQGLPKETPDEQSMNSTAASRGLFDSRGALTSLYRAFVYYEPLGLTEATMR